jgi:hypothetical protein
MYYRIKLTPEEWKILQMAYDKRVFDQYDIAKDVIGQILKTHKPSKRKPRRSLWREKAKEAPIGVWITFDKLNDRQCFYAACKALGFGCNCTTDPSGYKARKYRLSKEDE